ncbi:MAG: DUF1059 domain-containing protein [Patescibacteria group bacterium]|nr:DUF1059 domain-containing protein [Patescibacteria group bacterium]
MKQLTCKDIGVDCDVVFRADTEEGIMAQAAAHAASEHNLPSIPPDIAQKCRAAIKDVPDEPVDLKKAA